MRTITRMIIASAVAVPLALAAGGIASADTDSARAPGYGAQYSEYTSTAGPEGASTHAVYSSTGDYGYGHHYGNGYGNDYGWGYHHHHGLLDGLLGGLL
jgi:hypothetical protein